MAEVGGEELKVVSTSCQVSAVMGLASTETVGEVVVSCHFSVLVKSLWSIKGSNSEKRKVCHYFICNLKRKLDQVPRLL